MRLSLILGLGLSMLRRKVRRAGDALAVTLPSQLAEMLGATEGDEIAWDVLDAREGTLRAKIVKKGA
jgi:antitoxin component of MazEF toxin-antitoxin module